MNVIWRGINSVSSIYKGINPATLSGAIDVIVVEQEDGSLACSPFHIRFGKFSLLQPYEKKVEFRVNGDKQDLPMKLGEGGEAFFVFETKDEVPEALQTSPLVSPATSPHIRPNAPATPALQEPDPFELESRGSAHSDGAARRQHSKSTSEAISIPSSVQRAHSDVGRLPPLFPISSVPEPVQRPSSADHMALGPSPRLERHATDSDLPAAKAAIDESFANSEAFPAPHPLSSSPQRNRLTRTASPQSATNEEAKARAMTLSKKLWTSNISNQVTDSGDLMLDMTGFKSSDGEALHAEVVARQLLSEEIEGPYDIGALIGEDEKGNVWIYSSEEAKKAAGNRVEGMTGFQSAGYAPSDIISDPGYHSDDARSDSNIGYTGLHTRRDSDSAVGLTSLPTSPAHRPAAGDPNKNYAKTLRLTSDQLKTMSLKSGANAIAFTVNRATCNATLWYWRHDTPIVISDIDGTITKSDVMGHVMTYVGRDWTHQGVAKLYTDISQNGYNFLYLTSRSVGLADATRGYLNGVVQEGYTLPKGPVILSPDRTIAALRREVYLRKPEVFKMACLRDIMSLFAGHGGSNNTHESVEAGLHTHIVKAKDGFTASRSKGGSPFYAGFGNRITDAMSYRSVNIPSTRIFTINSGSEVSLDLLSLNKYKTAYSSMREIVDHYFPPIGLLVKGGGEEFTDFNYWRDQPMDLVDFTDSESENEDDAIANVIGRISLAAESVLSEDEAGDDMIDSYLSDPRLSLDESVTTQSVVDENELVDGDGDGEYEEEESESAMEDDADDEEDAHEDDDGSTAPDSFVRPGVGSDMHFDLDSSQNTPRQRPVTAKSDSFKGWGRLSP